MPKAAPFQAVCRAMCAVLLAAMLSACASTADGVLVPTAASAPGATLVPMLLYIDRYPTISPVDEFHHIDYAIRISHGDLLGRGDRRADRAPWAGPGRRGGGGADRR